MTLLCCSVYAECSDNLGILEWNSVTNTLVHFFPNQTGYLSAAPADDKIFVLDYDTPTVNVLEPRGAPWRVLSSPAASRIQWRNIT